MIKVLIVDDDQVLVKLFKTAFEYEGFEALSAPDGEEGFELVKSFKPDFILTDIMMPRVDGLTFLKNLKSESGTKDIPVVVMTNLDDDQNIKEAFKLGAIKHLSKIENKPKQIVSFVKEMLTSKKQ